MSRERIIKMSIWTLVIGFFLSRCVEAIQTAMPYEHKMVERDIIMSPMDRYGSIIHIYQDGATYSIKSYGVFYLEDLDTLRGRKCRMHYLNRRAFGFLPTYRLCKLECDGKVIFDHIRYKGSEYMGDRYVKVANEEWIEEWGNSVEKNALLKRRALRSASLDSLGK